jgi:hypothetical protein
MSRDIDRALCLTLIAAMAFAAVPARAAGDAQRCIKAQRKVAKEEKWFGQAAASIERDRKARTTCETQPVCERYDARIHAMEARNARHASRLARFKADAAKVCGAS